MRPPSPHSRYRPHSSMDIGEFPPISDARKPRDRRTHGFAKPLSAPRVHTKMQKAEAPPPVSQANLAAAADKRARADLSPARASCGTSSRSEASATCRVKGIKVLTAERIVVCQVPTGKGYPDPSFSLRGDPVTLDRTTAEISPSAITPARGVNLAAGMESDFSSVSVGSGGEVPESVTEPPGKGSDACQPANARRLALESSTVPVPHLSGRQSGCTTESSLENPPATDK